MSDIHILVTIKFYSSLGITISKIGKFLTEGNITLAITSFNDRLEQLEEAFWAKTMGKDKDQISTCIRYISFAREIKSRY